MRHSRAEAFEEGARLPAVPAGHWAELAHDPNAPAALAHRAEVLRRAWRPPVPDRLELIVERCRGRRVLDLGCVAHDVARMDAPQWLHGRLAAVAERCIGVDVLSDGLAAMRAAGFEVLEHDLRGGVGPLAESAPFDVIVAGELIEHVESVDMVFRTATDLLAPGGQLILTTPNPYAPHRVRAAQLGIVWENVDHILYAFPSGIAELADRHGLVLSEAAVTLDARAVGVLSVLRAVRRWLRGTRWARVGYASIGRRGVRRVPAGGWVRLRRLRPPRPRFLGETFVYVLRRPDGARR